MGDGPSAIRRLLPAAYLCLAPLLAGCGTYVTVRHPWVAAKVSPSDLPKIRRIYVTMRRVEEAAPTGFAGKVAGGMLARALGADRDAQVSLAPGALEEAGMLASAAAALSSPWTEVAGAQVRGAALDEFIAEMQPTAVLELAPGFLEAEQSAEERETRDEKGNVTGKYSVFTVRGRFTVAYRLAAWPDGKVLAQGSFARETGGEFQEKQYLRGWLEEQEEALLSGWVSQLAGEVLPYPVARQRKVRTEKDGALKAEWNAGVDSEKAGAWDAARTHYRAALAAAGKKGDRRELEVYLAELDRLAGAPAPRTVVAGQAWFDEPLAVLPFSNGSNNVTAPVQLRAAAVGRLAAMGYRIVPPADIDARLREKGVTSGDQLGSLKPADIAAAAGTRRILSGNVEVFGVVNVGVYYRREVRVRLRMLDAEGNAGWESVGECFREAAPDDASAAFIAGLVGGLVEKAARSYLKGEAEAAVLGGLNTLPSR